jgi:hypothetical protein
MIAAVSIARLKAVGIDRTSINWVIERYGKSLGCANGNDIVCIVPNPG